MACISCGRGLHIECFFLGMNSLGIVEEGSTKCCCSTEKRDEPLPFSSTGEDSSRIGRPPKPDSEITTSAGRKRAAILYPLNEDESCDWQGLANCGGGKFPIIGCLSGKQQHRHHGPVKNTSHNEDTNIHRICDNCHNLWHAKNDPVYSEEEYALLPHQPRQSTPAEKLARGV